MKRREFLTHAGAGSLIAGSALSFSNLSKASPKYKWKMVTTWPKNFPGLGTGANFLAKLITDMSDGRIEVKVYGAKDKHSARIYASFKTFRDKVVQWHNISELAYYNARNL